MREALVRASELGQRDMKQDSYVINMKQSYVLNI